MLPQAGGWLDQDAELTWALDYLDTLEAEALQMDAINTRLSTPPAVSYKLPANPTFLE